MSSSVETILREFFGMISSTKILGSIPLDIVLHAFFGFILTFFLIWRKKSSLFILFSLVLVCFLKEYFDSYVLTWTWSEAILDSLATMSYFFLVIIIRRLKS